MKTVYVIMMMTVFQENVVAEPNIIFKTSYSTKDSCESAMLAIRQEIRVMKRTNNSRWFCVPMKEELFNNLIPESDPPQKSEVF